MDKNIVLIQFSFRSQGNSAAIAAELENYYASDLIKKFIVDEQTVKPCCNCDYECLRPGMTCPNLNKELCHLMDSICNADLVYFIIPNYCGYPCANYFAFNERTVGYFNMDRALMEKYMEVTKRFIVISNTENRNFEDALKQQACNPEILYMKTGKYHKQSIAGDMMDDEVAKSDLKAFLAGYRL